MLNIYVKLDSDGYVATYRSDMEEEGHIKFEVDNFDHEKFRFYKQVNGSLVFDSKKYDAWISTPEVLPPPQKNLEEVILAKAETQTINIIMEMGLL